MQERVKQTENIELILNSTVQEIFGENQVTSVRICNKIDETKQELQVQGVFIAVGIEPNAAAANGLVEQNEQGYIVAGEDTKTSIPGIFVAGDVRTKQLRQVITAAADGANAITSVQQYLSGS